MTTNFRKVLYIGSIIIDSRSADIFCKVEFQDGRLSFSGVEGPTSGGNAIGGCGQIDMGYAHRDPAQNDKRYHDPIRPEAITFAPGWDVETWYTFLDYWKRWHLNDMQPACEHQRAMGWKELAGKEVTLYHFRRKSEYSTAARHIEETALKFLKEGKTVTLTAEDRRILSLPYELTRIDENAPKEYEPATPLYSGARGAKETKTLGWLYPTDHPAGILTKPCPVCGYKYGSAWLHEEVPADVIAFLRSLPESDITPAWV